MTTGLVGFQSHRVIRGAGILLLVAEFSFNGRPFVEAQAYQEGSGLALPSRPAPPLPHPHLVAWNS